MSADLPARWATTELCAFIHSLRAARLPEAPEHASRRNLLNVIGCALGGRRDGAIGAYSATLKALAGAPIATEIGQGRSDAATAAFLNAASANVQDFDDQHLPTVMHPGPPVVSAALAAAELSDASGAALLTAIAAGLETGCRIANAVSPGHYARGFHITATCGVFGAAAAAACLLGLDPRGIHRALGHAAAQAGGLVEGLGAASKSTGVGAAARAGLQAALFARAGLSGPEDPLEGRFGFLRVMADGAAPARIAQGLGREWEAVRNAPKAYPVGVVLHPVVDACLALRESAGFDAGRLAAVELRGHPLLRLRADRPEVSTGREATVSAQHVAAAALVRGRIGPAELTDDAVADAAVQALRRRIRVVEDGAIAVESVVLVAEDVAGRREEIRIEIGRGLPGRQLDDADLEAKVRSLAAWGAPWCDVDAVIGLVWRSADLEDLTELTELLFRPEG